MKLYNFKIVVVLTLQFLVFVTLLLSIWVKNNEFKDLLEKINLLNSENSKLQLSVAFSNMTANDLELAQSDFNTTITSVKSVINTLKYLLNAQDNKYYKYLDKSVSSINGELSRLLPSLRDRITSSGIKLYADHSSKSFGFEDTNENNPNFGFGLDSYEGFWPDFPINEANLLGLQASIIKDIVDFLLLASKEQPVTLVSILREPVGPTDLKYIQNNQINLDNLKIFRINNYLESYVFCIEFRGNTDSARTFVNQIRSPFHLTRISVSRARSTHDFRQDEGVNPFTDNTIKPSNEILPVVDDIESTFEIYLEYFYKADFELSETIERARNLYPDKDTASLFDDLVKPFVESL